MKKVLFIYCRFCIWFYNLNNFEKVLICNNCIIFLYDDLIGNVI